MSAGLTACPRCSPALALAAGARLADAIIPVRDDLALAPCAGSAAGSMALCALGAAGLSGRARRDPADRHADRAGQRRGRRLSRPSRPARHAQPAQVIAPSAAAFALVALAAAVDQSLGDPGRTLTAAPATTGGFAAAGAVLLALAVIASEEIAVLPFLHGPMPRARLAAATALAGRSARRIRACSIWISARERVTLSPEAASLLGPAATHGAACRIRDWIARIHPDDRDGLSQALGDYPQPARAGLPPGIPRPRARAAAIAGWSCAPPSSATGRAVRCLGLIADITDAQGIRSAAPAHSLRDPLTGLGNRVALMERLSASGRRLRWTRPLALLDLDRFKAIHASLGDAGADAILLQTARAAERRASAATARDFPRRRRRASRFCSPAPARRRRPSATSWSSSAPRAYPLGRPQRLRAGQRRRRRRPRCARSRRPAASNAELALAPGQARRRRLRPRLCARPERARAGRRRGAGSRSAPGAVEHDQLEVFYQPIMRLSDGAVAGFEALLRWHHPDEGPDLARPISSPIPRRPG